MGSSESHRRNVDGSKAPIAAVAAAAIFRYNLNLAFEAFLFRMPQWHKELESVFHNASTRASLHPYSKSISPIFRTAHAGLGGVQKFLAMIRSCQRIMITGRVFRSFWQKIAFLRWPKLSCTVLTRACPQPLKAGLFAFPGMFVVRLRPRCRDLYAICLVQAVLEARVYSGPYPA